MDKGKVEARSGEGITRVLQLPLRVVDAHGPRAEAGEENRPLRRAAAELEDVLPGHVPENLQLALGQLPHPPAGLWAADVLAVRVLVLVGVPVPERAVLLGVRQALRR